MLRFILFVLLLHFHLCVNGQSVITSTGNYSLGAQGSLSWTIGEPISETVETGSGILTQGFQQYYDNFLSTSELFFDGTLTVYPNPFENELMIQTNGFGNEFSITIYDAQLKEVKSFQLALTNGLETAVIDLSGLSAGAYFFTLENKSLQRSVTRQIIKLNETN